MANNITQIPATVETGLDQPLTDAQLRATPVVVSATLTPSGTQDVNIIQVNGATVTSLPVNDNAGSLTVDGTVAATQSGTWNVTNISGTVSLPTGAATEATLSTLNAKVTAVNTGAVVVSSSALPTGAATSALQTQPGVDIGDVTINNATGAAAVNIQDGGNSITVDGTVAATQSGTWNIGTVTSVTAIAGALPAGANVIGHVINDSGSTTAVTGNVTVIQGTATSLKTQAENYVGGTAVSNANPIPVSDAGGSITVDGTVAISAGSAVIGHVIADSGSTTAVTGNVTVTQGTGTNLHTVVDSGVITSVTAITNALPAGSNVIGHVINDSGSTTAVTGNVTVVQPTGTNLHSVIDSGVITSVTSITNALPAGTNLLGKTGIDQTTPGTTNKVSIGTDGTVAVSGNVAVTNAGLTNIDVLLSTRTKPADQQHTIIDSGTTAVTQATAANLNMTEASAAAILATLGLLTLTQGVLGTSTVGPMMQGLVNDLPNSYLPNYVQPLSLTSDGRLRVTSVSSDINKVWNNTFESPFFDENMFVGNSIYF